VAKGANTVTYRLDTSGVNELLANLGEIGKEIVRPVAQAGAEVIYEEAKRLAGRSTSPHFFYGTSWKKKSGSKAGRTRFEPGNLQKAIYQVYSKDNSTETKATYHVSWNFTKAPYGLFVEYGLNPFAPDRKPFLRPALINKYQQAVDAMTAVVKKKVDEL
jgi:hypothetical protein